MRCLQEGKQAAELMAKWADIDIADALELLSPSFPNPEVGLHTGLNGSELVAR